MLFTKFLYMKFSRFSRSQISGNTQPNNMFSCQPLEKRLSLKLNIKGLMNTENSQDLDMSYKKTRIQAKTHRSSTTQNVILEAEK